MTLIKTFRTTLYILLGCIGTLAAQEEPQRSALIESLSHSDLVDLSPPESSTSVSLFPLDITTEVPECYVATQQGVGHLLSMWNFQAYRFFLVALEHDENSLLATAGITLSLLTSDSHMHPQRTAAIKHLQHLLSLDGGSHFERQFGLALMDLLQGNKAGWTEKLEELRGESDKANFLPVLLNAYFSRDGYSILGDAKFNQQRAIEDLEALCIASPNEPSVLTFYILSQIDDPRVQENFFNKVLPTARRLVRLYPDFPFYGHLAGYCELRCGDAFLAEQYYALAEQQYEHLLRKESIPLRNLEEYLECKLGLITCLVQQGNYDAAHNRTQSILSSLRPTRADRSQALALYLWELKSFPIRIACAKGDFEGMEQEARQIADLVDPQAPDTIELDQQFLNCLRHYVHVRSAIRAGDEQAALNALDIFLKTNDMLYQSSEQALKNKELASFRRGCDLLIILEDELKTRLETVSPIGDKVSVTSRISRAIDNQKLSKGISPPMWFTPMEMVKADYMYSIEEYQEALTSYSQAYARMPNHRSTLAGLEKTLSALGRTSEASDVRNIVDRLDAKQEAKGRPRVTLPSPLR